MQRLPISSYSLRSHPFSGWLAALALLLCLTAFGGPDLKVQVRRDLDLTSAVVVTPKHLSPQEERAVSMLLEEVEARSQIRWTRTQTWPAPGVPTIAVGQTSSLRSMPGAMAADKSVAKAEGYRIAASELRGRTVIWVEGNDPRGVLFGIGRLLRTMKIERQRISIPSGFQVTTSPEKPIRGHQLGYRPKCNSYDGWTSAMWEQYIRDLVIFGCNAIELIPPRSDDDDDSPHFPLAPLRMMTEMSRIAADYGLDVWVWYPAMDDDYSKPATVAFALKEWGDVLRQLPRVDAVFVPGGDPGHTRPRDLLPLLEKQGANLRRFHPRAHMWVSPQSFNAEQLTEFYSLVDAGPSWLGGIVYGPQVRVPLGELRTRIPARYPIRDYPDITHSMHCQYPVPEWDLAFALTEGRETINPRPNQMAAIFHATTERHAAGFLSYSEGCNDDVNKAVWSALGWDPKVDVAEVLRDYSRYFVSARRTESFTLGLLGLERNWIGRIATNASINSTWELFQAMDRDSSPQEKLSWRFQQAVYRAAYDRYVKLRLAHESAGEKEAMRLLAGAATKGSSRAMTEAESVLSRPFTDPEAMALRARIFELGEALFQSIRMQLSTSKYLGMRGRGDNLEDLDAPLNNRVWLQRRFMQIRRLDEEKERVRAIEEWVRWEDTGPGGFHDTPGIPGRQPHVLPGLGWTKDPAFFETAHSGFPDQAFHGEPVRMAWFTAAESHFDAPLRMRYEGLDRSARYRFRVVYGHGRTTARVRLTANDSIEVHPWLQKENEVLEFDLPPAASAGGELTLTFWPEAGRGGNGRFLEIAETWLIRTN